MTIEINEVKEFLKIENMDEDNTLVTLIESAISYCENYLNRPIKSSNMDILNHWDVPESIRIAIYLLVGTWYENRTNIGTVTGSIAFSTHAILNPHRIRGI